MTSTDRKLPSTSVPPGDSLVGRLPFFIRKTLGLLSKYKFQYDDVVKLRIGEPTYLLTNPEDIKYVLVTNAENYIKTPQLTSDRGRRRAGEGLLTSFGTEHRRQRHLLQPSFRRHSVAAFADVIIDRTDRMLAGWKDGDTIDIAHEMATLAQSIIIGTVFGIEFRDDGNELAEAIHARRRYTEYIYHSHMPFRERLPTRVVRNYRWAIQKIDDTIENAIRVRRDSKVPKNDMVSMLMNATYPDGSQMNDQHVRDEVLTLTSTGYETIGEALGWTWYLLAQHPEVESQLLAELNDVLDGEPPCVEDVPKLRYTEMVLAESLRLYPPTWIYVRVPLENDTLPSGVTISANSKLYLCQYVMHRHPQYFPHSEQFDPERFSDPVKRNRMGFVYFPFGGGPHKCIGEMFAKLEGVLVLARIAQHFRFDFVDGQKIRPFAGITLRPKHGIRVRLNQR